jgi:TatD DNase family protein
MTLKIPDCHAHLDKFEDQVQSLLGEGEERGVAPIVSVGMDVESSQQAIELAWALRGIKAAIGLHPWKVGELFTSEDELQAYGEVASDPMVVAISEVGLDTATVDTPVDTQKRVLKWFIGLAQERGFPVILHLRAPAEELLDVWNQVEGRRPAAAIHSFLGSEAEADELLAAKMYLSVGPTSVGIIGDNPIPERLVKKIPDEKLLLDSDAFPEFEEWPEVHPAVVAEVANRVAEIRSVSLEDLGEQVAGNFKNLLRNHY